MISENYSEQKIIRFKQYKHFMSNKKRKFDFMELGTLENFPYPDNVQESAKEQSNLKSSKE